MTRTRSLLLAVPLLACSASTTPPTEPAPTEPAPTEPAPTEPGSESGLRMPAAGEYVAISDPSYGYMKFAAEAPGLGAKAPDFELPTHDGRTQRLYDALAEGPVVLMFYRGFW